MTCDHCHATTTNGLALCELCQRHAHLVLEYLPVYFVNLARWRPGRAGSRPVPGSRVLYDGTIRASGDRIQDALDEAGNALTTFGQMLAARRGIEAQMRDDALAMVAESEDVGVVLHEPDWHEGFYGNRTVSFVGGRTALA